MYLTLFLNISIRQEISIRQLS